jgi:reverse gyrase
MTHYSSTRPTRRSRRPASLLPTRSQVREQMGQLRDLYQLEGVLDQLHAAYHSEVKDSMEEQL